MLIKEILYLLYDFIASNFRTIFFRLHVSYFDIETVELGQSASNQININVVQSNLSFEGNYEIARVILG